MPAMVSCKLQKSGLGTSFFLSVSPFGLVRQLQLGSDQTARMTRGDITAFEELYSYACPKFVVPVPEAGAGADHLVRVMASYLPGSVMTYDWSLSFWAVGTLP